jgi:hypothetical protein
MPTEIYIEALLVDEDLADQVLELWIAGTDTMTSAAFSSLTDFLENKMRMSHVYQPTMIRTLLPTYHM